MSMPKKKGPKPTPGAQSRYYKNLRQKLYRNMVRMDELLRPLGCRHLEIMVDNIRQTTTTLECRGSISYRIQGHGLNRLGPPGVVTFFYVANEEGVFPQHWRWSDDLPRNFRHSWGSGKLAIVNNVGLTPQRVVMLVAAAQDGDTIDENLIVQSGKGPKWSDPIYRLGADKQPPPSNESLRIMSGLGPKSHRNPTGSIATKPTLTPDPEAV